MKVIELIAVAGLGMSAASATAAQSHRELGPHEHGVGRLNIAFEGSRISMEFRVPGLDIVGFEYQAESAQDKDAVEKATATLAKPLSMFVMPAAARYSDGEAQAKVVTDEHDDDDDQHHQGHTEFQGEYALTCADPSALTRIDFAHFELFPRTRKLIVQALSEGGTKGAEVDHDAPVLDLPVGQ